MNKLELLNQWTSQLSVGQIKDLPEEELLNFVMERPGHPGSFGFMWQIQYFKSDEHFAEKTVELMKRLGKIENLKEKMCILRQK